MKGIIIGFRVHDKKIFNIELYNIWRVGDVLIFWISLMMNRCFVGICILENLIKKANDFPFALLILDQRS